MTRDVTFTPASADTYVLRATVFSFGSPSKAAVSPIAPGLMLFTRIFRSFSSFAQLRANERTPALAASWR